MDKKILGVPVILVFFIIALLVPLLVADYYMYTAIKEGHQSPVVRTEVVPLVPVNASPSATITMPSPTRSVFKLVSPVVTVVPTVVK